MSGFDIALEKVLNKGELQKALAIVFNIQSEDVVVDEDYDSDPFTGDIKIWAIINQYDGGDFLLNCSIYIRDSTLEHDSILLSKQLCNILCMKGLISDDSPNPLTWLMISPDGSEMSITLDSDELDNDRYVINKA